LDEHFVVRRSHIHEHEPWTTGYPRKTAEYTVWNHQYVLGFSQVLQKLNMITLNIVVLTTIWVELMSDPRLFKLHQKVVSRDHKTLAAFALFLGGFCSRALVGKIGAAGTLGVGVGFRILIALSWIFVPGKTQTR